MKGMLIVLLCLLLSVAFFSSCQKTQEQQVAEQEPAPVVEEVKEIPAVCIWEDASVRTGASFKAKWISNMALGEKVILRAVADDGYEFTGWSGDLAGTKNPVAVIMHANRSIIANFAVRNKSPVLESK